MTLRTSGQPVGFMACRPARVAGWAAALLLMLVGRTAEGQMLRGQWVNDTEVAIRQHRTVPLRIILLDADGQPAPLTPVQIRMQRHAFPFGAALTSQQLLAAPREATTLPADPGVPTVVEVAPDRFDQPVWRALSAVSLERIADWRRLQPTPTQRDLDALDAVVATLEGRGMPMRLGHLVSADPAGLPPWVAILRGQSLLDAIDLHVADMLRRYGRRVGGVDLFASMLTFDVLGDRLGPAAVRRLFERARTLAPDVRIGVHFEDSLGGERQRTMLLRADGLRQLFAPYDELNLDADLDGTLHQPQFARALEWIADLKKPVVITGLTVDGKTPTAAAVNLETALRTLFASPMVEGIYLPGLGPDAFTRPQASLLDEHGQPTPCGQVFEGLVRGLWWDDRQVKTDELGNVELRLFAGVHELSARLPDGREVRQLIALRPGEAYRVIVLQPLPRLRQGPPVEDPLFD